MPIDPFTLTAIAQGVPALIQAGTGIAQFVSGNRAMKNNVRPMMDIPDSAQSALGLRRSMASQMEMPGQSQAEQAMNQQVALGAQQATQTAGTSSEALGALTNMFAARMGQQNDLAGQAAQNFNMNQDRLAGELARMADWEQQQFMTNQMQPFLDKAAMSSAMVGSGMQNMFQGITGAGGAVGGAAMNKALMKELGNQGEGNWWDSFNKGGAKSGTEASPLSVGQFASASGLGGGIDVSRFTPAEQKALELIFSGQ